MKQVDEQRARCDALEKRKDEKAQIEEKEAKRNKHLEEIQGLKKAIQQYKVISPLIYVKDEYLVEWTCWQYSHFWICLPIQAQLEKILPKK